MDEASNIKGNGTRIMLEGPDELLIEQSLNFEFKARNNKSKYETLIADMSLTLEVGPSTLKARNDSHLVAKQVSEKY